MTALVKRRAGLLITFAAAALGGFPLTLAARGGQREQAETLLARARELCDIRAKGVPPFLLKARLRLLNVPGGPLEGKYEEFRNSRGQWRRGLQFPDFKYTSVEVGDNHRMSRYASSRYAPYFAFRIEQMLRPSAELRLRHREVIANFRRRKIHNRRVDCVELKRPPDKREVCMDAESGMLVRLEERTGEFKWALEYAGETRWGGKRFPRRVREIEQGKPYIEIEIDELAGFEDPAEAWFKLPVAAEEWPTCDDPEPPEAVEHPAPRLPGSGSRRRGISGNVLTYVVVGVDGRVYNATPVRSDARLLATKTLDTVSRRWRFKPATCRGQPVPAAYFVATAFYAF